MSGLTIQTLETNHSSDYLTSDQSQARKLTNIFSLLNGRPISGQKPYNINSEKYNRPDKRDRGIEQKSRINSMCKLQKSQASVFVSHCRLKLFILINSRTVSYLQFIRNPWIVQFSAVWSNIIKSRYASFNLFVCWFHMYKSAVTNY